MADHVRDALSLRIDALQTKRAARVGQPAYAANVVEIDTALAELQVALDAYDQSNGRQVQPE